MKYLVMLIGDGDEKPWGDMSSDEQGELMQRFGDFDAACTAREGVQILAGEALDAPSSATVMRTREGKVSLTEGPFAEALEGLGGFYLVEAPDLDTLVELLRALPRYDMQIVPTIDV